MFDRLSNHTLENADAMRPGPIGIRADAMAESLLHRSQQTVIDLRARGLPLIQKPDILPLGRIQQTENAADLCVGRGTARERRGSAAASLGRSHRPPHS